MKRAAATLLIFAAIGGEAAGQTFTNLIFFGDSNTDNGRYRYVPLQNGGQLNVTGIFTSSPGLMWSEALGQKFGIVVTPSSAPGGGNNYAAGSARVIYSNSGDSAWSAATQINTYLAATGGLADPNALYTLYIGTNDLKSTSTGGLGNIVDPTDPNGLRTLANQTANLASILQNAGARYLLVPNISSSPMTQAAATAAGIPWSQTRANSLAYYNQTLWSAISANGINFIPADYASLANYVLLHPGAYGITNTNIATPACGGGIMSIDCTSANWVAADANKTHFFADFNGHVASSVQGIQADYTYNLLVAPGQISLAPKAAISSQFGIYNQILNQTEFTRAPGDGRLWIGGDVARLRNSDVTDAGSNGRVQPIQIVTGYDRQINKDWLVGASLGYSRAVQDYATGGYYSVQNFSGNLYALWRGDGSWMRGIASIGNLQTASHRLAALGITTERNEGGTRGTQFSGSFETGHDFTQSTITHGPLASLTLQSAHLAGFTEINAQSDLTALRFDAQRRDSGVFGLGWGASIDLGALRPFTRVVWNRELLTGDQFVTASIISVAAPNYSMPAVPLTRDWVNAEIGVRYMASEALAGFIAVSSQAGSGRSSGSATLGMNWRF